MKKVSKLNHHIPMHKHAAMLAASWLIALWLSYCS